MQFGRLVQKGYMIFVVLELVAVAVQFRPYHLNRHVILPQRAKLHRNRATCDLPQSSLVVHVTGMQSDGMLVNKSSQNSKDLTEPQTASTEHNGMYVDSLAQCRQYLLESQSTQAAGSRFPYLVVPSSASQAVYPSLYRPGLAYQEAAATAALFYNQLAAVHHLQQQQQRIFLGTQNQLTVPSSLSHAHSPLDKQNESAGLGRLQRADHAN